MFWSITQTHHVTVVFNHRTGLNLEYKFFWI